MKEHEKGYRGHIAVVAALYSLNSIAWVATSYFTGAMIDHAISGDIGALLLTALAVFGIYAFSAVSSVVAAHINLIASTGVVAKINNGFVGKLYSGALARFRRRDDAYYINMMVTDAINLRRDRYYNLPVVIGAAVGVLASVGVLVYISPIIAAASVVFVAAPGALAGVFAKMLQKRASENSAAMEIYTAAVTEAIQGYESIKLIGVPQRYFARFGKKMEYMLKTMRRHWLAFVTSNRAQMMLGTVLRFGTLTLGSYLLTLDMITIGGLMAAWMISSGNLSGDLGNFFSTRATVRGTNSIRDKFAQVFAETDEIPAGIEIPAVPAIEYKNVSFGFEGADKLYNNFSYKFEPGRSYAILGESGSGKSSLLKLLLKYYDSYDGEISIGGHDVRAVPESDIYGIIGVVNQSPFLMNDTLENNVTMFDGDNADIAPLLAELSLTALAERVGDTPLGDFGDNISGGERQRISIARTLRKKPRIIIFDEPTTGLDPENTLLINDYIFSLKGITRIVISHDWDDDYLARFDDIIRLSRE